MSTSVTSNHHAPVVFYISGHGFGHASRGIEVINALLAARNDLRVHVRTAAPQWLFDLTVGTNAEERGRVTYHLVATDTGVVQIDSLHLDAEATVRNARDFMRTFADRTTAEAQFLRDQGAALVVADLPPLGIAAAKAAGLPAIALGNFTWDWIYSAYANSASLVDEIAEVYATADVALRLPMHGGFGSFDKIVDLPFVARHSTRGPVGTRRALGLPADERLVLVSFGGFGLDGLDLNALSQLQDYVVVMSADVPLGTLSPALASGRRGSLLPFDERAMYAAGYRYQDLVRAVDVVVSKPGYGIISECIANHTALLYTSRGHFIEYDVLVAAMPQYLRCEFLSHADLFTGRWAAHLDAVLAQPTLPSVATDGASVAAQLILERR